MAAPMVWSGEVCEWQKSGARRSVLCVWQASGFSRREDVLTFNLLYKELLEMLHFRCDLQS
jgi:hypothetical protein